MADRRFADVFTGASALTRAVRTAGGGPLLADARRVGRLGWVNLLGLAAGGRSARTVGTLLATVEATDPRELHRVALGWRRRQLRELAEPEVVEAVLDGDAGARRVLAAVYASDATVLEATSWLLRARPDEVRDTLVRVLRGWSEAVLDDETEPRSGSSCGPRPGPCGRGSGTSPRRPRSGRSPPASPTRRR